MSDYSFLKTGFNNDKSFSKLNNEDIKNINALFLVLIENALELANKYITHANRTIITNDDIKKSIKLEIMLFLDRKDIFDKANNILFQSNNNIDVINYLDNILKDEENKDYISDDDNNIYIKNNCNCNICNIINNIDNLWNKWTPKNFIENILKNNADKM